MRQKVAFLTLAAGCVAVSGCADRRGGPIAYQEGVFKAPDAPVAATLGADYRISALDKLSIRVFRSPELSGDYDVDLTGKVSMPLIGDISAVGLTTEQLDERLTTEYGRKYLQHPDIAVGIKSSSARVVTVDGAVTRAGSLNVMGPMTLMQAIAQSGGLGEHANARRVAIFRQIDGRRQAAAFDLTSIRRGENPDPAVYAGDIVVVDGSSLKAAQKQLMNSLPILSIFRPF